MSGNSRILVFGDKQIIGPEDYDIFYIKSFMKYLDGNEENNLIEDDYIINQLYGNPLELRLNQPELPLNIPIITTKEKNLKDIKNFNTDEDYSVLYPMEKKIGKINPIIKKFYNDIQNISKQMFDAGYHEENNIKKIDDWIITFEDPVLKFFVTHYNPEIKNDSSTCEEEFLENPQFRKLIHTGLLKILSNYIVNNDLADVNDFPKDLDWMDKELWEYISKKKILN